MKGFTTFTMDDISFSTAGWLDVINKRAHNVKSRTLYDSLATSIALLRCCVGRKREAFVFVELDLSCCEPRPIRW